MASWFARKIAAAARPIMGWRSMQLVRVEPGARGVTLTEGTALASQTYRCRGRVVSVNHETKEPTVGQTRTTQTTIALLGATLSSGIEPKAQDKIVVTGANAGTYLLSSNAFNDDGLGAVWMCITRKVA